MRDEYPSWVNPTTQKNNGTLQGTSIYAGAPAAWNTLPSLTQTFGYDTVNRLTSATESGAWSQAYNYDQYGNMWIPSSSLPVPPTGPAAPTANVYTNGNNRNANSGYDASGNLLFYGATTLRYDAENRQTAAGGYSYSYDAAGQRVERNFFGLLGPTVFVHDAFGQLAAEYNSAALASCVTCYLSYDYLGSVRMVTDANANVIARHDFAPFGQEIPATVGVRTSLWGASDNVSQRFTGQIRDSETNLDFFNARVFFERVGKVYEPRSRECGGGPDQSAKLECVRVCMGQSAEFSGPERHGLWWGCQLGRRMWM